MVAKDFLQDYPQKRLKPIDGLAVTADVWEEAHEFHRKRQRYHNSLAHGYGVLAGLEVKASKPADSYVYIDPGIAISPAGDEIAIGEPVGYDLGNSTGMLYLILNLGESQPAPDTASADSARLYINYGYEVEARNKAPDGPFIELARIRRLNRDSPITDAADPAHPQANQIDRRYRRMLTTAWPPVASVAISYLGGFTDKSHTAGFDYLIRDVNRSGVLRACSDTDVALTSGLSQYTLVHLVGQGPFQMKPDDRDALYLYLNPEPPAIGGTLYIENARRGLASGEPPADPVLMDMLSAFGLTLEEVKPGHELLSSPNLFAALPAGYEVQGKPKLLVGGGVIFSTYDYANVWQGERRGTPASREDIRAAHEFGANILAYAMKKHLANP